MLFNKVDPFGDLFGFCLHLPAGNYSLFRKNSDARVSTFVLEEIYVCGYHSNYTFAERLQRPSLAAFAYRKDINPLRLLQLLLCKSVRLCKRRVTNCTYIAFHFIH